jgi:hypothetical protein
LSQDWLANTLDPTPVFSLLVEYTERVVGSELLFYVYYAFLLGIYLYSIFGIIDSVFRLRGSWVKTLAFFSAFLLLHAAATRYLLSTLISPDWAFLFEGGVANQRVLGTVFQPSIFGVLLVFSIYLFLLNHSYFAIIALALAATIHPTYLLSAGILTTIYMWITYWEEKQLTKAIGLGVFALVLVLPILAYAYFSFATTPSETTAQAREILVNFRIPHHAVISEWWNLTVLLDLIFVAIALYLIRGTKLFTILLTGTLVGILLTLAQLFIQSDMLALIFPWRISVIIVPLSTSIIPAFVISMAIDRIPPQWAWFNQAILAICSILIALLFAGGIYRMSVDFSMKNMSSDREMMSFVQNNQTKEDVYLVPIKMQDFRLVTGAPIYVDFKSIPYKDTDVLEWHRRQRLAGKFYRTQDCDLLIQLSNEDQLTHLVLEASSPIPPCPFLKELHQDDYYRIFIITTPMKSIVESA